MSRMTPGRFPTLQYPSWRSDGLEFTPACAHSRTIFLHRLNQLRLGVFDYHPALLAAGIAMVLVMCIHSISTALLYTALALYYKVLLCSQV